MTRVPHACQGVLLALLALHLLNFVWENVTFLIFLLVSPRFPGL